MGERRRWSDDFKERAISASLEAGVNISALARSLGCRRRSFLAGGMLAVRKAAKDEHRSIAEPSAAKAGRVEIEVGGAVLRASTDIAEDDLRRFLRAMREA